jgi:hypothetical protein
VIQYCGYEGLTLNMLHSPLAAVHAQRWPQLSPAMWIGNCHKNGTTAHGWTRDKWKAHPGMNPIVTLGKPLLNMIGNMV